MDSDQSVNRSLTCLSLRALLPQGSMWDINFDSLVRSSRLKRNALEVYDWSLILGLVSLSRYGLQSRYIFLKFATNIHEHENDEHQLHIDWLILQNRESISTLSLFQNQLCKCVAKIGQAKYVESIGIPAEIGGGTWNIYPCQMCWLWKQRLRQRVCEWATSHEHISLAQIIGLFRCQNNARKHLEQAQQRIGWIFNRFLRCFHFPDSTLKWSEPDTVFRIGFGLNPTQIQTDRSSTLGRCK